MKALKIEIPEGFEIDNFDKESGEIKFKPVVKDVKERIKTFRDVLNELGITEGEWEVDPNSWFIISKDADSTICQTFNRHDIDFKNKESNSKLIADAGTTANKCGLLPSELLEQKVHLLDALQEIIRTQESKSATLHALNTKIKASEKLIQSIEKTK